MGAFELLLEDALQIAFNDATVAAMWEAVGSMNSAFRQTVAYMRERKQFGKPIGEQQLIQQMLADCAMEINAWKLPGFRDIASRHHWIAT